MKRTSRTLFALAILIGGSLVVGSCASEHNQPVGTTAHDHPVGEAIEGTYDVIVGTTLIGYLEMDNGRYVFSPKRGAQIPEDIVSLPFLLTRYPEGSYSIEYYYGYITQDTLLEDKEDNYLLSIKFTPNGENEGSGGLLIASSKELKELYFISIFAYSQRWNVVKSWD